MQQNMSKSAMMNGLIVGAMLSAKFILGVFGSNLLSSLVFIISILIVVALFWLAKKYRDQENGGVMTYGQAFTYIFQMYFYGSIISSLVLLGYTALINPEYLANLLNDVLKLYDGFNFNLDDSMTNMIETMYKPAPFALLNVFGGALGGAFWGLILAAFVKKEKSIFE